MPLFLLISSVVSNVATSECIRTLGPGLHYTDRQRLYKTIYRYRIDEDLKDLKQSFTQIILSGRIELETELQ